jgi:hypothetical protein
MRGRCGCLSGSLVGEGTSSEPMARRSGALSTLIVVRHSMKLNEAIDREYYSTFASECLCMQHYGVLMAKSEWFAGSIPPYWLTNGTSWAYTSDLSNLAAWSG